MQNEFDGVKPLQKSERDLVDKVAKVMSPTEAKSVNKIAADAGLTDDEVMRALKHLDEYGRVEKTDKSYRLVPADERG